MILRVSLEEEVPWEEIKVVIADLPNIGEDTQQASPTNRTPVMTPIATLIPEVDTPLQGNVAHQGLRHC